MQPERYVTLLQQVEQQPTIPGSISTLMQGLAAQIQNANTADRQELAQWCRTESGESGSIVKAVTANTPAATGQTRGART